MGLTLGSVLMVLILMLTDSLEDQRRGEDQACEHKGDLQIHQVSEESFDAQNRHSGSLYALCMA